MKLFILDRTPLKAVQQLKLCPSQGDAIIFLRLAQAPVNQWVRNIQEGGVEVIWGETLLDYKSSIDTERLGARFVNMWYLKNGVDASKGNNISLGRLLDADISRLAHPKYIIRTGEIIRRAINRYSEASLIVSDLTNGQALDNTEPAFRPMAELICEIARQCKLSINMISPVNPIPPLLERKNEISWFRMGKQLLGNRLHKFNIITLTK